MDIQNLKNIVGEAKADVPATIRFFGQVTAESTAQFNSEFEYLEECIKPSCIRVLINSEGGSVLHGMTTYSTIQNSTVPTECIIEGLAASMGSVIWAAGDKSLMRDYSILMIHNPCIPDDKEPSDIVKAFTKQIETIYHKRFGLKKEHIQSIMKGEAGKDGTFFDATSAVKNGIIPFENIIQTSMQFCNKVKNGLTGAETTSQIVTLMSHITAELEDNNPFQISAPILIKTNLKHSKMDKNNSPEYNAVVASLGMKEQELTEVVARISELVAVEAKLAKTDKDLSDAQTVIAGKEAAISNLQKDLTKATASLSTYQEKENKEKQARIEQLVEAAIAEGKVSSDSKPQWVKMADSNLELAEQTLASIPVRENITDAIASDSDNVQAATDASKTAQSKMAEKVSAVVGENFQFGKIG